MNKLYLAYGSNLNVEQMHRRCPTARIVGYTYLPDTRLIFRGSSSGFYLSIEPEPGASVPCGVFRIFDRDERQLDIYEGYPRFYRKVFFDDLPLYDVRGEETQRIYAMAYALNRSAPAGFPSTAYWKICMQGYRDFGFNIADLQEAMYNTMEELK